VTHLWRQMPRNAVPMSLAVWLRTGFEGSHKAERQRERYVAMMRRPHRRMACSATETKVAQCVSNFFGSFSDCSSFRNRSFLFTDYTPLLMVASVALTPLIRSTDFSTLRSTVKSYYSLCRICVRSFKPTLKPKNKHASFC